jgi:hypothetical protein
MKKRVLFLIVMLLTITVTSAQNAKVYMSFDGANALTTDFTSINGIELREPGAIGPIESVAGTTTSTYTIDPSNTSGDLLKRTASGLYTHDQFANEVVTDSDDSDKALQLDHTGHVFLTEEVLGDGDFTISYDYKSFGSGVNKGFQGMVTLIGQDSQDSNTWKVARLSHWGTGGFVEGTDDFGFDVGGFAHVGTPKYIRFTLTYSSATQKYSVYKDGVFIKEGTVITAGEWTNRKIYLGFRGVGTQDATTGEFPEANFDTNSTPRNRDLQKRFDDITVFNRALTAAEVTAIDATPSSALTIANVSWDGSESSEWTNGDNWSTGNVPTSISVVTIPTGMPNQPVIAAASGIELSSLTVDSGATLTVESGGSLIVNDTSSGDVTYNVAVTDTNWHLATSPVSGEGYDDTWVSTNSIATGSVSSANRGIATYQNGTADVTTGNWVYVQGGASGTFGDGVGYSLLSSTGTGNFSFTGAVNTSDISPSISQNTNNWNLIGNSYTSYLDVAAFITANSTNFGSAFQSIYVWNGSAYVATTTGYVYPGQAFFVSASATGTTASFTTAMQSHQTGTTFLKSSNSVTSIKLNITDGTSNKTTSINYLEGKTEGLDPGFDIGMFNGVSSDLRIYTHLVNNNEGIAFTRQALSDTNIETTVIPVGLKAAANQEITFSAEALNLPSGVNVFLEDKQADTFTRLDEANSIYKVRLFDKLDGTGRFFIHTSTDSALSLESTILEGVSVYKSNSSTLRIVGLSQGQATVKLFNVLGKQMMKTSFETSGSDEVSLSNLATGVYIVQLETENGKLNKKIILE